MTAQLPAQARSVLRQLIRSIDRNVTSATGNTLWRQAAIEEFRRDADPSSLEERLQLAQDYAFLLDSVREHKELLLSYNIGVPVDQREKDMNQRAAQLVGLRMPGRQPSVDGE